MVFYQTLVKVGYYRIEKIEKNDQKVVISK